MMVIDITLSTGVITPEELTKVVDAVAEVVPAGGTEGIILSGRLPVWAYGALVHYFHPRPWVATFDPRLGGGVVVMTHTSEVAVGDVVPVDGDSKTVQVVV